MSTRLLNKKTRSKAASATKRMIDRARPDNVTEPEAAPVVEALADAVATLSVEPAIIVVEVEGPSPS